MSTRKGRTREHVTETPHSSSGSPNSSVSRWSRQQEKDQLSNLNDRLATYIERVRNLETENGRLQLQIRDLEVIERKEKTDISARYEAKVNDLRKQLDLANRDKAKLEIERAKASEGYSDLKDRLNKAEKELKFTGAENTRNYELAQDLIARLNNSDNIRNNLEKENKNLKKQADEAEKSLEILRRQLEDEVVLRTELENRNAVIKEDLDFMRRTHANQLEEIRQKRQVEMTSFSTEIENRYQVKLQEQLQAMREDFDDRTANSRGEIETLYKNKLTVSEYNIHKLEDSLRDLQEAHAKLISDYQDLLDLKIQLDTELQAYQKLLEGEETRLHITPVGSPASAQKVSFQESSSRRGVKRKRLDQESYFGRNTDFSQQIRKAFKSTSHADGNIVVEEVDTEGKFIRLENQGTEDTPIGGWIIKDVGGDKEVMFKFHSRQIIKSGKTITVWSNDSNHEHAPPTHIVMKNQGWAVGEAVRVELMDDEREVKAWREMVYEYDSTNGVNPADPNERCSIM